MDIIINVRRGSGVHNVRRRKLPHGPQLKGQALPHPFLPQDSSRHARSLESD